MPIGRYRGLFILINITRKTLFVMKQERICGFLFFCKSEVCPQFSIFYTYFLFLAELHLVSRLSPFANRSALTGQPYGCDSSLGALCRQKPCIFHTKLAKIRDTPLLTQQLHKAGTDLPSSAIAFDFTVSLVDFLVMNFLQKDVSGFLKRTCQNGDVFLLERINGVSCIFRLN